MDAKEIRLGNNTLIGKANGIPVEEIDHMTSNTVHQQLLDAMTEDEKFEHLYYLVLMMKSDGRLKETK